MTDILRDATCAWSDFVRVGGLEPGGRDKEFAEEVWAKLDRDAANLDAALSTASVDALVIAIFGAIGPFGAMYRDILNFFRHAGALEGKRNILLKIDEAPFDLKEFERFLSTAASSPTTIEIPVLTPEQAFALARSIRKTSDVHRAARPVPEVREWLDEWRLGRFSPLPLALAPSALPSALNRPASILETALSTLLRVAASRKQAQALSGPAGGKGHIFEPTTIAAIESDLIPVLAEALSFAAQCEPSALTALNDALDDFFQGIPHTFQMREADAELLEKILSLPAWKQRHELYAVWVATEIIGSVPNHNVEIHAPDGVLEFGFKGTLLATIGGHEGDALLYAERREKLEKPLGKGRKGHVQPDYGIWRAGVCRLVVEVKHYKRTATRSFTEAMADYAAAHLQAEVALVNYGPTSDMLDKLSGVPQSVRERCCHIGYLTPPNAEARGRLSQLVVEAAGLPPARGILLIDISGSMKHAFHMPYRPHGTNVIASWLGSDDVADVREVVLADTEMRWRGPIEGARAEVLRVEPNGGTDLLATIRALLTTSPEVMVATDYDGLSEIDGAQDLEVEHLGYRTNLTLARVRGKLHRTIGRRYS